MADEHKGIALVILGIVAVIAIVGLVLLFTGKTTTGQGVYGGALKNDPYPYWTDRGVPRNTPGVEYPGTPGKDMQTHWNYYDDSNNRNPYGDVPSAMRKCETGGFLVGYQEDLAGYYASIGYNVVNPGPDKAGMCVYPPRPMVGGIAGYS